MIEGGIGHCAIVAPDGDSQTPGLDDLNHVIERKQVIWRTRLDTGVCRGRIAFVLVGKANDLDIAQPKLANQAVEHHQSVWPLYGVVIKMSVSRKYDVDP